MPMRPAWLLKNLDTAQTMCGGEHRPKNGTAPNNDHTKYDHLREETYAAYPDAQVVAGQTAIHLLAPRPPPTWVFAGPHQGSEDEKGAK